MSWQVERRSPASYVLLAPAWPGSLCPCSSSGRLPHLSPVLHQRSLGAAALVRPGQTSDCDPGSQHCSWERVWVRPLTGTEWGRARGCPVGGEQAHPMGGGALLSHPLGHQGGVGNGSLPGGSDCRVKASGGLGSKWGSLVSSGGEQCCSCCLRRTGERRAERRHRGVLAHLMDRPFNGFTCATRSCPLASVPPAPAPGILSTQPTCLDWLPRARGWWS